MFVSKNIAVCMDFKIHYLKYVSRCGKVKKKKVDYSKVIRVMRCGRHELPHYVQNLFLVLP